jgi:hypothetical protein
MKPKPSPTIDDLAQLIDAVEKDTLIIAQELAFKTMTMVFEAAKNGPPAVSLFTVGQRTETLASGVILNAVNALEIVLRRIDPTYKHNNIKKVVGAVISSLPDAVETKEQSGNYDKILKKMKANGGKVGSC